LELRPSLCEQGRDHIAPDYAIHYNGVIYRGRKGSWRMESSRQLIGIAIGAALGAVLGAVLFDYLALGPGALGAGIGAALGALLGGVLGRQ